MKNSKCKRQKYPTVHPYTGESGQNYFWCYDGPEWGVSTDWEFGHYEGPTPVVDDSSQMSGSFDMSTTKCC